MVSRAAETAAQRWANDTLADPSSSGCVALRVSSFLLCLFLGWVRRRCPRPLAIWTQMLSSRMLAIWLAAQRRSLYRRAATWLCPLGYSVLPGTVRYTKLICMRTALGPL